MRWLGRSGTAHGCRLRRRPSLLRAVHPRLTSRPPLARRLFGIIPLLRLQSGLAELSHRASKRNGYSDNMSSFQAHRAIAMTVSFHYLLSPTCQPEHLWPSDSPLLVDLDVEETDW